MIYKLFAQIQNCPDGQTNACFTNVPQVAADRVTLENILGVVFAVLAAIAVLIIVIQGIRFVLSQGDSQKAADARKGVIYAVVGLVVALLAEAVVRLVIGRL